MGCLIIAPEVIFSVDIFLKIAYNEEWGCLTHRVILYSGRYNYRIY